MKTAIIGAGRMGRRHMQVVREMGLELAGICDVSQQALALAAAEHQVPSERQFSDARVLFNRTRPECVVIATTAPSHCEYTCLAAESGAKYILCEKPMAVSLEECNRMIAVCERAGALLAINHPMRFMEQYTVVKKIVDSAEFGGLASTTVIAGNVGIAMNASHYFEMFRFMTGEPVRELTAWFAKAVVPNPRGPQFEDRAGEVRAVTASGKRLYFEAGDDQGHGVQVVYAGRQGLLFVDELTGFARLQVREEVHRTMPTTRYGMPWVERVISIQPASVIGPTQALLAALFSARGYTTGAQGRAVVEALVAAYVSHENGHMAVEVNSSLPQGRVFPWA
ncbi:MAG: Gfo/Idh/MocA family oxidoreductase [Candidatus Omnitrophica bacterium]|nr:Gfo/Idh/MocA family oxidoreductase [Candidatus Omnitrophota bacterium]